MRPRNLVNHLSAPGCTERISSDELVDVSYVFYSYPISIPTSRCEVPRCLFLFSASSSCFGLVVALNQS